MILTYLALLLTFAAGMVYGKKLYGSWVAAVFLALFCGPLLAVASFLVNLCLIPVVAILPKGLSDNEAFKGFVLLISAGLVTAALRYYAKTEGASQTVETKKPEASAAPSSYDDSWK